MKREQRQESGLTMNDFSLVFSVNVSDFPFSAGSGNCALKFAVFGKEPFVMSQSALVKFQNTRTSTSLFLCFRLCAADAHIYLRRRTRVLTGSPCSGRPAARPARSLPGPAAFAARA